MDFDLNLFRIAIPFVLAIVVAPRECCSCQPPPPPPPPPLIKFFFSGSFYYILMKILMLCTHPFSGHEMIFQQSLKDYDIKQIHLTHWGVGGGHYF